MNDQKKPLQETIDVGDDNVGIGDKPHDSTSNSMVLGAPSKHDDGKPDNIGVTGAPSKRVVAFVDSSEAKALSKVASDVALALASERRKQYQTYANLAMAVDRNEKFRESALQTEAQLKKKMTHVFKKNNAKFIARLLRLRWQHNTTKTKYGNASLAKKHAVEFDYDYCFLTAILFFCTMIFLLFCCHALPLVYVFT